MPETTAEAPAQPATQNVYYVLSSPLYAEADRAAETEGNRPINSELMELRRGITALPGVACRPEIQPFVVMVTFRTAGISEAEFMTVVNVVGEMFNVPYPALYPELPEGLTPGIIPLGQAPEFHENGRPNVEFPTASAPVDAPDNSAAKDDRTAGLDTYQVLVYAHAWMQQIFLNQGPLIEHWCHKTGSSYELLAALFQNFVNDVTLSGIDNPMTNGDADAQHKFREAMYLHAPSIRTIADEVRGNALPIEQTLSQGCVDMLMDGYRIRHMPYVIP